MLRVGFIGIGLTALCLQSRAAAEASTLAKVRERGQIVVLTYGRHDVFFKQVGPDEYRGIDHDLMRAFAESLEVKLVIRTFPFAELIPALLRGEGDVIASTLSITPSRQKLVDFSLPYFPVLVMILAPEGRDISSPAELTDKLGCVVHGSSQAERLEAVARVRMRFVTDWGECFELLNRGEADFTAMDSTRVLLNLDRHPRLRRAFDLPGQDQYGFAVVQGSDLKGELDRFLVKVRRSSYIYFVVEKHLGRKGVEFFRMAQTQP